jgi:hypothetical protein
MTLFPELSDDPDTRAANVRFLFLRLWNKAYDGPRYDKCEWILMLHILEDAGFRIAPGPYEPPGPPYDPSK